MITDHKARKAIPLARGVLDYFPDALAAIAEVSRIGSEQHHPGTGIWWERDKSADHPDCILRHMVDRGKLDIDGTRHTAKAAWRILAMLQLEIEAENEQQTSKPADNSRNGKGKEACVPAHILPGNHPVT
jgi:Domain of unknown function (DUF5664)